MNEITDIKRVLDKIESLENQIISLSSRIKNLESPGLPDVKDRVALFLSVPDTLRKSLFAVSELGTGTADDVSEITERHRSIENKYLNELARAGWLTRSRDGKKIYYELKKRHSEEQSIFEQSVEAFDEKLDKLLG